jgi:hypothetical protein
VMPQSNILTLFSVMAQSNITILKRTVKICFILLKNMHFRPYRI